MRKILCILSSLCLLALVIGTTEGQETNAGYNPTRAGDYNMTVVLKPGRIVFPHFYSGDGATVGFKVDISNKGPGDAPSCHASFKVTKILGRHPGLMWQQNWTTDPLGPYQGIIYPVVYLEYIQGHFGVFKAEASINIDDNNPTDNTDSFTFYAFSL